MLGISAHHLVADGLQVNPATDPAESASGQFMGHKCMSLRMNCSKAARLWQALPSLCAYYDNYKGAGRG